MTDLSTALRDYLTVRRALGHKLERAELLLGQFAAYCDQSDATRITTDVAVAWATLPADGSPGWWGQRLSVVRSFAAWLQTVEPDTEIPPTDILSARNGRAEPYLYTDAEVAAIMAAAQCLRYPLGRLTYEAFIGLVAVAGLRVGEAIRLDRPDVDLDSGVVQIRLSKFNKSREVLLHPSAIAALRGYARARDQLCPTPRAEAFFLSSAGTRLIYCNVSSTFSKLRRTAGLGPRSKRCRPRIHDLRHSFAVHTLIDWHKAGADVQALLPLLSTWMGHVDPKSTFWYLSAAPELMALAARRLEDTFEGER